MQLIDCFPAPAAGSSACQWIGHGWQDELHSGIYLASWLHWLLLQTKKCMGASEAFHEARLFQELVTRYTEVWRRVCEDGLTVLVP